MERERQRQFAGFTKKHRGDTAMITIKRIYDPPSKDDGYRVSSGQGVSKEETHRV